MRHITLVRHAQASFLDADYDKSVRKVRPQARLLGKYWLRRGVIFQKVYSGPRVRQQETCRVVAAVYRAAGHSFPEIEVMSEFDEYQAQAVMRACLPQLMQVNAEIRKLRKAYESSSQPGERRGGWHRIVA
jgi:broad specificity phosphatase PhoE